MDIGCTFTVRHLGQFPTFPNPVKQKHQPMSAKWAQRLVRSKEAKPTPSAMTKLKPEKNNSCAYFGARCLQPKIKNKILKIGGGVASFFQVILGENRNLNNFRNHIYNWSMIFFVKSSLWTTFRRLLTFAVCQSVPQKLSGFGLRSPFRGVQKRCLGQGANVCTYER